MSPSYYKALTSLTKVSTPNRNVVLAAVARAHVGLPLRILGKLLRLPSNGSSVRKRGAKRCSFANLRLFDGRKWLPSAVEPRGVQHAVFVYST
jgi:hypothetical protein